MVYDGQHAALTSRKNLRMVMAVLFCMAMCGTSLVVPAAHAQTFAVLHTFTGGADGAVPGGAGLTIDRGGNLYGGTDYGGLGGCYAGSCGVLYKLSRKGTGWIFDTLHEFAGSDGASPDAPLAFGPDGALYGTTFYGGRDNIGVIYRLQPPVTSCKTALCYWTETVIYQFTGGDDGAQSAFGALSFDSAGNIYGTAVGGGADRYGTVFELSPSYGQWVFKTLWSFTGSSDGSNPWSGVIFDSSGNLYGTTTGGGEYEGGTAYELTPSGQSWTLTPLHQFNPDSDGNQSFGNLVFDSAGDLLGTNRYGGPYDAGGVFELTPYNGSWNFAVLHSFSGEIGPQASVAIDQAGNLYGTSVDGGKYNAGLVFKMTPSGGGYTYTVLHDFTGGADGGNPYGQIVLDADGNLYGGAEAGGMTSGFCGNYGCGVVWEITP